MTRNGVSSLKKRRALFGGTALGVVLFLTGLIVWYSYPNEHEIEQKEVSKSSSSKISDGKPHLSTNLVVAANKEKKKRDPDILRIERHVHPGTGEYVLITQRVVKLPPNASHIQMDFPGNVVKKPKRLYDTYAENYIVGLIRTKPGLPVVNSILPPDFDEEFESRIADPVGVKDDDTEEDIAIRKQVHDFKKQVAQLIAQGKTPTEIVLQERKEMNRIADMRINYMRMISDMKKDGAPQEEIDLTIEAANQILDKNGGTHIKFITPYSLKREGDEQK